MLQRLEQGREDLCNSLVCKYDTLLLEYLKKLDAQVINLCLRISVVLMWSLCVYVCAGLCVCVRDRLYVCVSMFVRVCIWDPYLSVLTYSAVKMEITSS